MDQSDLVNSREIRVFLSSTFRDMEEERNYLTSHVFPIIRKECEDRNVGFTVIDLRWGITEHASKNGRTIEICLNEIDRCRKHPPFFIGFLGERYGWIPQPEDLVAYWRVHYESKYAQIIEEALHQGVSVTELEMEFSFLNREPHSENAKVFLRSPTLTKKLYNNSNQTKEDYYDAADGKLLLLKQRLRESEALAIDGYQSIVEFGEAVKELLLDALNNRFPKAIAPTAVELQQSAHDLYAATRLQSYIPQVTLLEKTLDALKENSLVIINGPSGRGKSAFMANLARELEGEGEVLLHFVGCDGYSTLDTWLAHVITQIKALIKLKELAFLSSIPEGVDEQWQLLPLILEELTASLKKPIFLLLDAVDQFNQGDELKKTQSLVLPRNCRLVCSTTQEIIHSSSAQILTLPPLTKEDRSKFIEQYLSFYGKSLSGSQVNKIVEHKACQEPLFLRLLLDELRLCGSHELLNVSIDKLLLNHDAGELFQFIIENMDRDYSGVNSPLVATNAIKLIAISYKGLRYHELAYLLTHSGELPALTLSPLVVRLDEFCFRQNGRLRLMHQTLQREITKNKANLIAARQKLIEHFSGDQSFEIAERLYQYERLDDFHSIYKVICSLNAVLLLYISEPQLLREVLYSFQIKSESWLKPKVKPSIADKTVVEDKGQWLEIEKKWSDSITNYLVDVNTLNEFSEWLLSNSFVEQAKIIKEALLKVLNSNPSLNKGNLKLVVYDGLAGILQLQQLHKEAEKHYLAAFNEVGVIPKLDETALYPTQENLDTLILKANLASLYAEQEPDQQKKAVSIYLDLVNLYRKGLLPSQLRIDVILSNLASLYLWDDSGNNINERAVELYLEVLEYYKLNNLNEHLYTAIVYIKLAHAFENSDREDQARVYYEKASKLKMDIKQPEFQNSLPPSVNSNLKVRIAYALEEYTFTSFFRELQKQGNNEDAERFMRALLDDYRSKPEKLFKRIPILNSLFGLYQKTNRNKEAEVLLKEEITILKQRRHWGGSNNSDIARALKKGADFFYSIKNYKDAEEFYLEAIAVKGRLILPTDYDAIYKHNLAVLYEDLNQNEKAKKFYDETVSETVSSSKRLPLKNKNRIVNHIKLLKKPRNFYYKNKDYANAAWVCENILKLNRSLDRNNDEGLVDSLVKLALVYRHQGRYEETIPLYKEALKIFSSSLSENNIDFGRSLYGLAFAYYKTQQFSQAKQFFQKALKIYQMPHLKAKSEIIKVSHYLAKTQDKLGNYKDAENIYLELMDNYQRQNPKQDTKINIFKAEIASIYMKQNRHADARPLLMEAFEYFNKQNLKSWAVFCIKKINEIQQGA